MARRTQQSLKRVVLEAIKEHLTIPQIVQKFKVYPSQIKHWRQILMEQSDCLFEHGNRQNNRADSEGKKENLLRIIGKLQVEIDFLKKRWFNFFF